MRFSFPKWATLNGYVVAFYAGSIAGGFGALGFLMAIEVLDRIVN